MHSLIVIFITVSVTSSTEIEILNKLCEKAYQSKTTIVLDKCIEKTGQPSYIKILNDELGKIENLTSLTINNTDLFVIPDAICNKLELQFLQMHNNNLKNLPSDCFNRLKNIEIIKITNNLIERLEEDVFDGLLKLEELVLNNNLISYIGTNVFSNITNLPNLLKISLGHNKLTSVDPWPILRGVNLNSTNINVEGNKINKFTNNLNWFYNCSMRKKYGYSFIYVLNNNRIEHLSDFIKSVFKADVDYICLLGSDLHSKVSIFLDEKNPFVCDCVDYKYMAKITSLGRNNFMNSALCYNPPEFRNKPWISIKLDELQCNLTGISCLQNCSCFEYLKQKKLFFHVICNSLTRLPEKLPQRYKTIKKNPPYQLSFSGSTISVIDNHNYYKKVTVLDLSKNQVFIISEDALKSILTIPIVYLHSNNLTTLPHIDVEVKSKSLSLHGNQWDCSCENVWFKHWLEKLRDKNILLEPDSIYCQSPSWLTNRNIFKIDEKEFCENPNVVKNRNVAILTIVPIICLFLFFLTGYFVLRKFKVQLNTYLNIHPLDKDECEGEDMEYDAFISCSYLDRHRAIELVQMLESRGFHICYHEKDFIGGVPIAANIQHAIIKSKRVICLLSESFLKSSFCMYEVQMALDRNISIKKNRLITLLLMSANLESSLTPDYLNSYLQTHTYIKVDKANKYIDQLLYSMPVKKLGISTMTL